MFSQRKGKEETMRQFLATALMAAITCGPLMTPELANAAPAQKIAARAPATATPIQHVVVIFQENVSFDHYFGTYPNATNPAGEPEFHAAAGTPSVNGYGDTAASCEPEPESCQRRGCEQPVPSGPLAGRNQRPGPQLHSRAAGV